MSTGRKCLLKIVYDENFMQRGNDCDQDCDTSFLGGLLRVGGMIMR